MPFKSKRSSIGKEGVAFVRSVVERSNCIFHEIHGENDYGVDALVQLVTVEQVTAYYLGLQIKSGQTYVQHTTCRIPADGDHFRLWASHAFPIIGVVYDPSAGCAYWTDITAYLWSKPIVVREGPYVITFPKNDSNVFNDAEFQSHIIPVFLSEVLDPKRSILLATMAHAVKAPLHGILGYAEEAICALQNAPPNIEQAKSAFESISSLVFITDKNILRMIGRTAQAEKQPKLQHHIVFLDDEADTISLKPTVAALERAFNVTIMTSPDELISFLTKVSISIDILLLDMIFLTKTLHPLLLDVSGLEMGLTLLELIRSGRFGDRYRKLPVLVLTASTIPDTMEKIKILSQDSNTSVIYKPCSPSHIVKEVQNIINGRL